MKHFKLINNLFGWLCFLVAAVVYGLTIEPTASFWDCGEFISTAFKMEVGHPPGAPFFMLVGKFFTLFTSGPTHVARMVNLMSAMFSGFTWYRDWETDRKSTRLNSSHSGESRMPSSA